MRLTDSLSLISDQSIRLLAVKDETAKNELFRRQLNARLAHRFARTSYRRDLEKIHQLVSSWGPAWQGSAQILKEKMESLKNDQSR